MKRVAIAAGLHTPSWAFAYAVADVLPMVARSGLVFPLIVKVFHSHPIPGMHTPSLRYFVLKKNWLHGEVLMVTHSHRISTAP